jgi:hypothetical protein
VHSFVTHDDVIVLVGCSVPVIQVLRVQMQLPQSFYNLRRFDLSQVSSYLLSYLVQLSFVYLW